jgi:hypothetical protein
MSNQQSDRAKQREQLKREKREACRVAPLAVVARLGKSRRRGAATRR